MWFGSNLGSWTLWAFKPSRSKRILVKWWWQGTITSTITTNSIEDFCGGDGAWTHWSAFHWCCSYCWWFTWTLGWWTPLVGRESIRVQSSMAMLGGGRLDVALATIFVVVVMHCRTTQTPSNENLPSFFLKPPSSLSFLKFCWSCCNFLLACSTTNEIFQKE